MLLTILILIKTILFIGITNIQHNTLTIFLFTSLISLLILSGIELINNKYKKSFKIVFYTIFSIIMFVDIMHYSYFQSLPSVALLGQVGQLSTVGDSIKKLLSVKNLLFIIDVPFVVYFILKKQKNVEYSKKTIKRISMITGLVLILVTSVTVSSDKLTVLTNQEFYAYHTSDIINMYFTKQEDEIGDIDDIFSTIEETDGLEKEDLKHYGIGKDRNLIVVQMESLQNFVINLNYNGQEVTPNLNAFIKDKSSIYFDEYFQLIGRGNTSDAEFITNNSLHPSSEEPTYNQYEKNTFYGLPWILRDNGYTSWAFHGFEKEFWNRNNAYVNQGFQRFISEEDFEYEEKIVFGISDREFYEQTLEYLKEMDEIDENPFYSFVVTLSCHTPYNLDEKYHVLDIKEPQKGTIVGDYLQAVHYADKEFGKFIEGLKREGLYDSSVIAVYGDHYGINNADEEVFEPMEDILGEKYNFDHIMNIPLIINVPGEQINETISKLGSQLDFAPTILNIMGLENEKGYMMGMDLINSDEYNYVAPQRVMRRGSFIDKDIIFNISRDGIFENSTAIDRETRQKVDLNEYRDIYEKIIADINKSDLILKNNLLKNIIEKNGDIDKVDISKESDVPSQKNIKILQDYTVTDLNDLYDSGDKIIRIYIDEKTNLKELETWMNNHEDAYLILKSTEEGTELLEKIKDEYKELKDRYICEIDDFNKHFLVQRRGYKNIILDIRYKDYSEQEVLDFLNLHTHLGIIVDDISEGFETKLRDKGIRIYMEEGDALILRSFDS